MGQAEQEIDNLDNSAKVKCTQESPRTCSEAFLFGYLRWLLPWQGLRAGDGEGGCRFGLGLVRDRKSVV